MARKNIKTKEIIIEKDFLGKYDIVAIKTTYEHTTKNRRAAFTWDWSPITDLQLIARFNNDRLGKSPIQDYYSFKYSSCKDNRYIKLDEAFKSSDFDIVKKTLTRLENGTHFMLTEKELDKWVYKPNRKNNWGFNKQDLISLIRGYKKANPIRQFGYEERLTDANFHSLCDLLSLKQYDKCLEWIEKTYN